MVHYSLTLKSGEEVRLDAEKFQCGEGSVIFYSRPEKGKPFEEVARYPSGVVKFIEEN